MNTEANIDTDRADEPRGPALSGPFGQYLDEVSDQLATACTACGDCFTVCPVVPLSHLKDLSGEHVTGQVRGILRGLSGNDDGDAFADLCTNCGQCLDVCPESINPRRMLTITKYRSLPEKSGSTMAQMNRGLKILSGLQLSPTELELIANGETSTSGEVDIVFHASCNLMRTPHITLNVMKILDELGARYVTVGGAKYCCGAPQLELRDGGRDPSALTKKTLQRFAKFGAETVLTWCPTCLLTFGESLEGIEPAASHMQHNHVIDYVAEVADTWADRAQPIPRRVALHLHPSASAETSESARQILERIPGLTVVELPRQDEYFDFLYVCMVNIKWTSEAEANVDSAMEELAPIPALTEKAKDEYFHDLEALEVDELITLYHPCHRFLVDGERQRSFAVRNITDLIMETLGLEPHEDRFKRFKNYGDVERVMAEASATIAANGLDSAVVAESLEQLLSS